MSTSPNNVRAEFVSDPLYRFDPEVGYVRIPAPTVTSLQHGYDEGIADGTLSEEEAQDFRRQIADTNRMIAEADALIKERLGSSHFYGEVGGPLLLMHRFRFGMS